MLTYREVMQRAEVYNGRIVFNREYNEYRVTLNDWRGQEVERKAYYTDDLDDALHTLAAMRREQNALVS